MGHFSKKTSDSGRDGATVFKVWGRGWPNVNVVGESYHLREIKALFAGRVGADGEEAFVPVTLIHDPDNPYDRNAVEVRAASGLIGHLSREEAARYAPALTMLQQNGFVAATTARVWGAERDRWDSGGQTELVASVQVDLPDPHMLIPANSPPSLPYQLLPPGGAIQVTGEENHLPAITPYLNQHGECWTYATLHSVVEQGARTDKMLAEVRIDGNPVGRLTPKMSTELLPAVTYLAERGYATAVRALVKGNRLKAEVVLQTLRAHELPADWFTSVEDPSTSATSTNASAANDTVAADNSRSEPGRGETTRYDYPPPAPPAGWYPDPGGVERLRYWDGIGWTDHTSA